MDPDTQTFENQFTLGDPEDFVAKLKTIIERALHLNKFVR